MSITKRATTRGNVVVSKTMLECPKCGRRDVGGEVGEKTECPVCKVAMVIAFCSTGDNDE